MSYDDDLPPSEPTQIMPTVPTLPPGGATPPPPMSPPGTVYPSAGGPDGPNPNRTPMIIAGVGAAFIVLFAIILAVTRGGDDELTTADSTLPTTVASSTLPPTTLPATTLPASTAPATTGPTTVAPTAPTTAATTTLAPTTTVAPTTTAAPTTTVAPTTTAAPTTTTTTLPPTPLCATGGLSITLGDSEGAAGSTYTEVYVANTGSAPCVLDGPGVMRFTVGGAPVGGQLTASSAADLELAPGGVATALWRMSPAGLFDCTPSDATKIELVFGAAVVSGPAYDPVCETPPQEQGTLQGFTPGLSDLVPPSP